MQSIPKTKLFEHMLKKNSEGRTLSDTSVGERPTHAQLSYWASKPRKVGALPTYTKTEIAEYLGLSVGEFNKLLRDGQVKLKDLSFAELISLVTLTKAYVDSKHRATPPISTPRTSRADDDAF